MQTRKTQNRHLVDSISVSAVVDSASVVFSKRHTRDITQSMSCEIQSQWFLLKFIRIMVS